jgi:hypothetical protein
MRVRSDRFRRFTRFIYATMLFLGAPHAKAAWIVLADAIPSWIDGYAIAAAQIFWIVEQHRPDDSFRRHEMHRVCAVDFVKLLAEQS